MRNTEVGAGRVVGGILWGGQDAIILQSALDVQRSFG